MKKHHHAHILLWSLTALVTLGVAVLLFLNFYPVRESFEKALVASTQIYDRNGILLYETLNPLQGKTSIVKLSEIAPSVVKATIATEDANFYNNYGVDFTASLRALWQNIRGGRVVSGGSTITQQLVRNVMGVNRERSVFQKVKESLFALRAAKVFSKDEILEMYLNKIYYGNLNYGIAAASQGYFGKDPLNLDLAESAFLAGLPQAPNRYNPFEHREDALARKNYVLSLMERRAFITPDQRELAQKEELVFENNLVTVRAPHFVHMIVDQLNNQFGPEFVTAGLKVTTTLDYAMQQKIQEIARRNIQLIAGRNVTNASVVVLDAGSGQVRAMLGSLDYFDEKIDGKVNIATSSRQPGSALKPITYGVAFEKGWNGATVLKDEPVRFFTADGQPYYPKNYDFEYHGDVTVRDALANSYNIPAVHAIEFAGVDPVLQKARQMGLTTLNESADHYGLALTLGDGEVRLLDLASAYTAFADAGVRVEPQQLLEVRDRNNEVIFSSPRAKGERVFSPQTAFMITDILSDKEARLPEFGLRNVLELSRPAAVKTGTTRNFRDNWTMGYTPDFVVGVWVGNSDNSAMQRVSGIYGAGPIWHDVMEEVHRGVPVKQFIVPPGVEKKSVCVEQSEEVCVKSVMEYVVTGNNYAGYDQDREIAETATLRIAAPFDHDEFMISKSAPLTDQQVKFEAAHSKAVTNITWSIRPENSENAWTPLGTGDAIFWQLQAGEWEIQVSGQYASGTELSDIITIKVE